MTPEEKRDLELRLAEWLGLNPSVGAAGIYVYKPYADRPKVFRYVYWNPTANHEQAFMLVEALRSKGNYLDLSLGSGGYNARFDDSDGQWQDADSAPMAICLAAAAAVRDAERNGASDIRHGVNNGN
jgi:hypothetical protein